MNKDTKDFLNGTKKLNFDGTYIFVNKEKHKVADLTKEKISELMGKIETKYDP